MHWHLSIPATLKQFERLVMHACELVELAAVVAIHGPVVIRGSEQFSAAGVEQYWTASKCRLDRWGRSLKRFTTETERIDPQWRQSQWPFMRAVVEEILTGEVLTRVWTAVVCAHDRHLGREDAEPVARSILIGHLEARHRVLTLLVRGPGVDTEQAVKMDRLRRRTERWTDMLVGYLAGLHDISEFAIDSERAKDFAEDLNYQSTLEGGRHAWSLIQASLRAAFRRGLAPESPNADLNTAIAAGIISCFQPELFDSTGVLRSFWLTRLCNATHDAQGMIAELLALEHSAGGGKPDSLPARLEDRLRPFGE